MQRYDYDAPGADLGFGTSRLASTPARGVYAEAAYAPFGETYSTSGVPAYSFTGQTADVNGDQYDFLLREHNPIQGRWYTPDPAGRAAVNPNNPQSWNRYAYVLNNPLRYIDPLGLAASKFEYGCVPVAKNKEGKEKDHRAEGEFGPYDPGNDGAGEEEQQQAYTGCANGPKGIDYILDGVDLGFGGLGAADAASGGVGICPGGACSGFAQDSRGRWSWADFVATAGGVEGYYHLGDLEFGIHDYNGQIYSDAGGAWSQEGAYLAYQGGQCSAVASGVAATSGASINGCSSVLGLRGANENYTLNCRNGGCSPGRYPGGIHIECSSAGCWAHMDTASPFLGSFSWSGLNIENPLIHFGADVVWGNIGTYVIPRW